jgi:uncharacterized protein
MAKKALVTGASEGIGKVFAEKLSEGGYQVMLVARNEGKLKACVAELGNGAGFLVADLSTHEGQAKVVAEIQSSNYDLLVNNAGVGTVGKFTDVSIDKQLAMLRLNCEALVSLSYAFLKKAKKNDALINVSSTLAFLPMPTLGLYSATKAFVTSFTESLWFEQKERGVFVMDLCPGVTSTRFQTNAGGKMEDLPKGMSQTPEVVVDVALAALRSRSRPTVISGSKNRVFAALTRFMPRKTTVNIMGKMTEKMGTK